MAVCAPTDEISLTATISIESIGLRRMSRYLIGVGVNRAVMSRSLMRFVRGKIKFLLAGRETAVLRRTSPKLFRLTPKNVNMEVRNNHVRVAYQRSCLHIIADLLTDLPPAF